MEYSLGLRFRSYNHCRILGKLRLESWSKLAQRIQELGESIKNLAQEFKESDRKRTEDTKKFWEDMHIQLERNKAEIRTEIRTEFEAKLAQDKAETDAKLKEVETEIRTYLEAKLEQEMEKGTNNENATFISDSAEKLINRPHF